MKSIGNPVTITASGLAGLLLASMAAAGGGAEEAIVSPLKADDERIAQDDDGLRISRASVPLVFDAEAYAAVKDRSSLQLTEFPLAPLGRGQEMTEVTLELTRSRSVNEHTHFLIASIDEAGKIVEQPMETPDVAIFSGRVVGEESSFVFLSLSPHGSHGFIRTEGVTQVISPGPYGEDHTLLIYNMDAIPRGAIHWHDFLCDAHAHDEAWPDVIHVADVESNKQALSGPPCRLTEIAVETDKEFTDNLFGGDQNASGAYVATLLSASSEIFEENINVSFDVVYVRLWTNSDPWTGSNTTSQLFQFRDYWNSNMGHIQRDVAHFLSGRQLGGGVAWLNAVCHSSNGYALSANLNGSFPYPLQDNHPQNWDIMVVTHEFGHNFGTPHTHDFCPPLDECAPLGYFGSCQNQQNCTNQGTIMSYCHLCSGGLGNVVLEFHPLVRQTMLNFLDGVSCDLDCNGEPPPAIVYVPLDTFSIQQAIQDVMFGGQVIVSPGTYNETINPNGKAVHIYSTGGPEVTVINASGQSNTVARFSSGESSQTILEGFTLTGGTGALVNLGGTNYLLGGGIYTAGSSPDIIDCIVTGNSAQFGGGAFNNDSSPSFSNCTFAENSSSSSGGGAFNFSGAAPTFANVQFIENLASTSGGGMSNQGSNPTVIDSHFIDNQASSDGGAVRNIQSSAGLFIGSTFQGNSAGGNGGAVFNDSSPSTAIGSSEFCDNSPNHITGSYDDIGNNEFAGECPDECPQPTDLNCDGAVDGLDLLILLGAWGDCADPNDCPPDLNDDGAVDGLDLLILLGQWG